MNSTVKIQTPNVKISNLPVKSAKLFSPPEVGRMNSIAIPAYDDFTLENYTTEQHWNARAMGCLRAKTDEMAQQDVAKIEALYAKRDKKKLGGVSPVTYARSIGKPGKLGYGRFYGTKGSLETLPKNIRGSLCDGLYSDVDIVNCHPVLISQLSKKLFDEPMPQLQAYCDQRDDFLQCMKENYNVSEDVSKELLIRILYNGALETIADDVTMEDMEEALSLFDVIKKEVHRFTTKLIESTDHDELYKYLQKQDKNTRGSFLSFVIQREETKCLKAMVYYFIQNGIPVDVLAYDGCQTRGSGNITPSLLRGCEAFIKDKTGYTITLKIKPFTCLDLSEPEPEEDPIDVAYRTMKTDWERSHFHFKQTNTVVEVTKAGLHHYTWDAAKDVFNTWLLPAKGSEKRELFVKRWREDATRRMVDSMVYKLPQDCGPTEASLFLGFAYKQFDRTFTESEMAGAVEQFLDLVRCVCGDEEEVYTYVIKSFAHIVQKPFERTGVCTIFSSKTQGTGKDTVMLILKSLVGRHTAHYISDDAFWSPYDTSKEGALVMYLEEAGSAANKAKFNALKARITADSMEINPKGVRAYSVPNVARYFMTTNEEDPVRLEESDRRFLLINPSNRLVGADWPEIYRTILSAPWLYAVGTYLETLDITNWNPRKFPVTEAKKEIAELSESLEKKFLRQWKCEDTQGVTGSTLFADYQVWCQENGYIGCKSSISFCKKILPYRDALYKRRLLDGISRYISP